MSKILHFHDTICFTELDEPQKEHMKLSKEKIIQTFYLF